MAEEENHPDLAPMDVELAEVEPVVVARDPAASTLFQPVPCILLSVTQGQAFAQS